MFPYTLCLSGHFLGLTAVARARHGSEVQQTFRDSKLCGFVELEDAGPESQLCIQSSLQNGTSEYYSLADAHCCRRNRDSGPCALFGTAWPITCMLLGVVSSPFAFAHLICFHLPGLPSLFESGSNSSCCLPLKTAKGVKSHFKILANGLFKGGTGSYAAASRLKCQHLVCMARTQ